MSDDLRDRVQALEGKVATIEARLTAAALVACGADVTEAEPEDPVAAGFRRFRERVRKAAEA